MPEESIPVTRTQLFRLAENGREKARRERLMVNEWVRRALRDARASRPVIDPETKLKAVRRGAECSFPTADIEQMLGEIERGYQG